MTININILTTSFRSRAVLFFMFNRPEAGSWKSLATFTQYKRCNKMQVKKYFTCRRLAFNCERPWIWLWFWRKIWFIIVQARQVDISWLRCPFGSFTQRPYSIFLLSGGYGLLSPCSDSVVHTWLLKNVRCIFTELYYCVEKGDRRLQPVCSHPLNNNNRGDLMMGYDECTSPSGVYELEIPVNRTLSCTSTVMRDTNCKDLDVSWVYFTVKSL